MSEWTADQLRELLQRQIDDLNLRLDERFQAQSRATDQGLRAAEKASDKADAATERRFESVNEFRQALSDQTASFVTRSEYDLAHRSLIDKVESADSNLRQLVDAVDKRMDVNEGALSGATAARANLRLNLGQMIALATMLLFAISIATAIIIGTR